MCLLFCFKGVLGSVSDITGQESKLVPTDFIHVPSLNTAYFVFVARAALSWFCSTAAGPELQRTWTEGQVVMPGM